MPSNPRISSLGRTSLGGDPTGRPARASQPPARARARAQSCGSSMSRLYGLVERSAETSTVLFISCAFLASTTGGGASASRCRIPPACWPVRGRRSPSTAIARRRRNARRRDRELLAEDDGLAASCSGIRESWAASRPIRPPRWRRWPALRSAIDVPVVLQDERLSSREAESLLARRHQELARPQAAARRRVGGSDPAGLSRQPRSDVGSRRRSRGSSIVKRLVFGRSLAVIVACARRRWRRGPISSSTSVQGLCGRRDVRRDRRRAATRRRWPARSADAGVVAEPDRFRMAVWLRGAGRRLQAGEYRFDAPLTPRDVVDKIARGDVFLRPVTFREGLTIRQMAAIFEERGFGPQAEFVAAASNAEADPRARPAGAATSRATSSPTPTRCRAARPRTSSWRGWSRASRRR